MLASLKLTAKACEKWWLEDDPFFLKMHLFSGANSVSFRECTLDHLFGWMDVLFFLGSGTTSSSRCTQSEKASPKQEKEGKHMAFHVARIHFVGDCFLE